MNEVGDNRPFEQVLDAARRGEHWAVARLWRDLHPRLLAWFRVADPLDAEDLASEVWLELARTIGRFRGDEDGLRRLTFTIARRRLIDRRRKRARQATDAATPETLADRPAPDDPEATATERLTTEAAIALVRTLPEDQAEAVLLRVLAGLDADHAARVMGKRAGTVRVLQHRGLKRLAQELGHEV
jgi:RNA polymerase sigma-70 factor (ECF subfamily)